MSKYELTTVYDMTDSKSFERMNGTLLTLDENSTINKTSDHVLIWTTNLSDEDAKSYMEAAIRDKLIYSWKRLNVLKMPFVFSYPQKYNGIY